MAKKIALDAGHGYNTPGKRTPKDVREWTLNDAVCRYTAAFLTDYDVEITRVDDTTGKTDVSVQVRTNKINAVNPDISISIHHNANTGVWGTWTGVEVYSHASKPKRDAELAKLFADEISKQTGLKNRSAKQADFHMVRETKSTIPSVLCEGGFMDSTVDEPVITSEKGQKAYAQAVANVCIYYLGLKKKSVTPIRGACEIADTDILTAFVRRNNANFNSEIAKQFIKQGKIYNVRGDIALCQSIIETGWFKYTGSAVTLDQNNFCGMGVTSLGEKGNSFATVELGAKAQIQHLFAYSRKDALPSGETVIDPRFSYVSRGIAPNWMDLNGKWAVPGTTYGQDILKMYDSLKAFAAAYKKTSTPPTPKIGDPLGKVLYTDIRAYINGHAIPVSVANSKTLVIAEDLKFYGFDIEPWDKVKRELRIERNKNKAFAPLKVEGLPAGTKSGDIKCNYVYTDIKTYLDGVLVESYCIDGRTLIDVELLERYGGVEWDKPTKVLRLEI